MAHLSSVNRTKTLDTSCMKEMFLTRLVCALWGIKFLQGVTATMIQKNIGGSY